MGRGGRGGSRSSGGRSRSSSRSSGGRRSSSRSSSRGSSYSSRSSSSYRSSRGYSGSRHSGGSYHSSGNGGNFTGLRKFILIWIIFAVLGNFSGLFIVLITSFSGLPLDLSFSDDTITKSTIEREALPWGSVDETDYYIDELDWIYNKYELKQGLYKFYHDTGVQPFLYITDTVNGTHFPTDEDFEEFTQSLYDQLFTDEAHFLMVFHEYESGEYSMWYVVGNQARSVMDEEACNILMDYIDRYYYSDYSEEEFFSTAFSKAADRIMKVDRSPWPVVIGLIVVLAIIIVLFKWWKKAKQQKNLEAEQTERILSVPLESFGDASIDELAEKYDK